MIIHPTKTVAGRNATWNASRTGIDLNITHMSIGDTGGDIDDTRTQLRRERERVSVYGSRIDTDTIQIDAAFDGSASFWVREVGIWADSVLVYYWATTGSELGYKTGGSDWLLSCPLKLDSVEQGVMQITAPPPNILLTTAPQLATILKAMCDSNRLLLRRI